MTAVKCMSEHHTIKCKGAQTDDKPAGNLNHCVHVLQQFLTFTMLFSIPGAVHGPVTRIRRNNAMEWHIYFHLNIDDTLKLIQVNNIKITLTNTKGVSHLLWYRPYTASCMYAA